MLQAGSCTSHKTEASKPDPHSPSPPLRETYWLRAPGVHVARLQPYAGWRTSCAPFQPAGVCVFRAHLRTCACLCVYCLCVHVACISVRACPNMYFTPVLMHSSVCMCVHGYLNAHRCEECWRTLFANTDTHALPTCRHAYPSPHAHTRMLTHAATCSRHTGAERAGTCSPGPTLAAWMASCLSVSALADASALWA